MTSHGAKRRRSRRPPDRHTSASVRRMPADRRCLGAICAILGYHEIAPLRTGMRRSLVVTPRTFAAHLAYLRASGGRCVSLDDVRLALDGEKRLPRRAFALTFDDGYTGVYRHALPLLRRFGCTATVFVPSAAIGRRAGAGDSFPVETMDAQQLREWLGAGMSIGAHSRTHVDLPTVSPSDLESEIGGCIPDLEFAVGASVRTFCYPYGKHDRDSVEAVRRSGYALAVTNRFGVCRMGDDPFRLPRVTVGNNLDVLRFIYRLLLAGRASARTGAA